MLNNADYISIASDLFSVHLQTFNSLHLPIFGRLRDDSVIRVIDSGSKGHEFESHWRHCVMSLSKTFYPPCFTRSSQEARKLSKHDGKIADWDVKHQQKKTFIHVKMTREIAHIQFIAQGLVKRHKIVCFLKALENIN